VGRSFSRHNPIANNVGSTGRDNYTARDSCDLPGTTAMADVFISYSKKERRITKALADDLVALGYTVWWDTGLITGEDFRRVIARELTAAKAAIVIWTPSSVQSDWVISEAQQAHEEKKLIPVRTQRLEIRTIPRPYNIRHTASVTDRDAILSALKALGVEPSNSSTPAVVRPEVKRAEKPPAETPEEQIWQFIKDRDDPALIRKFLERFGDGAFANLARQKLTELETPEKNGDRKRTIRPARPKKKQPSQTDAAAAPSPPAPPAISARVDEQRDEALWKSAQRLDSIAGYERYLKDTWPDGRHITRAQAAIDRLAASTQSPASPAVVSARHAAFEDEAAWARARKNKTAAAYREYLAKAGPSSRFFKRAQAELFKLERGSAPAQSATAPTLGATPPAKPAVTREPLPSFEELVENFLKPNVTPGKSIFGSSTEPSSTTFPFSSSIRKIR
jgi:hypothetical protein